MTRRSQEWALAVGHVRDVDGAVAIVAELSESAT